MVAPSRVLTTKVRHPGSPGGLARDRLLALLPTFSDRRLVLVVAPAGAGKTTLLAQFLSRRSTAKVWYRADAGDRSAEDLLRHLRAAAHYAGLPEANTWRTPTDLVCGLENAGEVTIAVDDLHTLNGSEAMDALAWILEYAPDTTTVLAAGRSGPDLPLPKLRVADDLAELGADDLRFRTWETEALFRTVYDEPLPPEELAMLTRRTQGWAAGLQLYHLAISGKPGQERKRMLEALRGGSTLLREYLTADVLDDLRPELRNFLLQTCVLGTLTPQLCDELLGTTDSADRLEELTNRQIFTQRIDPAPTYRYHEVLRSYLEASLFERRDAHDVSKRYRRAGELLLEAGHHAEALRAFSRGEAWDEAAAVVRNSSVTVSTRSGDWIDDLPEAFVADDPWLLLVRARRQVAAGRFRSALETYRAAEATGGATHAVDLCVEERLRLSAWLSPEPAPRGANGILRSATRARPFGSLDRWAERDSPGAALMQATLAMLGGDVRTATARGNEVLDDLEASSAHVAVARLVLVVSSWLRGSPAPRDEIAWSADTLEQLGMTWPARIASAALALCDPPELETARRIREEQEHLGNGWGAGLARLFEGLGRLGQERSASLLDGAAEAFAASDASVLEAWARSAAAVARAGRGQFSPREIDRAHSLARAQDVPGALLLASVAGSLHDDARPHHAELAEDLEHRLGISVDHLRDLATMQSEGDVESAGSERTIGLSCLGRFALHIGQGAFDIESLKPQVRLGLFFLAVNVGRPIHREEIAEAFWPDSDPGAAVRNVQVLVSSLRSALADAGGATIVRRGEAYKFVLPDGLDADFRLLGRYLDLARRAERDGDRHRERVALERALDLFHGPLLPEAGPQDWLAIPRRRVESQAADAARRLAQLHLDLGDDAAAVRAAERGLEIARFDDQLWQLLMAAHDRAGDAAGLSLAQERYAEALRELDLDPEQVLGSRRPRGGPEASPQVR